MQSEVDEFTEEKLVIPSQKMKSRKTAGLGDNHPQSLQNTVPRNTEGSSKVMNDLLRRQLFL